MKKLACTVALAGLAALAVAVQEPPVPASLAEHQWLQQLVGEWTVTIETTMAPGAEPMKMESSESVRAIGDYWVLAEQRATFFGMPFTAIMTLGYDPRQNAFVGSWIDTFQTHMWTYTGKLDASKKVLTLEAEGPSHVDPDESASYRDVLELKSADHKVMTSSMLGEDGTWTTFMRADFRRKE